MSVIRLHDVSLSFDDKPVLKDVFLKVSPGDRIALIGKNGSGKSSVLNLMLGREEPTSGRVEVDDVRIGHFSQFSELDGTQSVTEVLDACFERVHAIEAELAEIATSFEDVTDGEMERLLHRQADLMAEMDHLDGWNYHQRIDIVLTVLGFSDEHRTKPIDQLSGGWRNRAALAKIVLEEPDVLLLDEPTNYLDMAGLEWLETWFQTFRGGVVVVSHDRQFLDAIATMIIEIENLHLQEYEGNYTQYVRQKPLRMKKLEKQFVHEAELLALEAAGIADREAAARAPGKQLRRKLANVKKSKARKPMDQIVTDLYAGLRVRNELCRVDAISKAYDGVTIFENLSFDIDRRDRIAAVGPNGCGKSTLINVLTGAERPDSGEVAWSKGPGFVYFNEWVDALDLDATVSHAVNATPGTLAYDAPRKKVHAFLSLFQFTEMDLKTRIRDLSGGQRARVALAQCLLSGASAIVLDEPTNHLDTTSTQVMERALMHFPGAVVVVSHDRYFIDNVATRLLVFSPERGPAFVGE